MSQKEPLFSPVKEKDVTRAIVRSFMTQFDQYVESDAVVVGAGPSGRRRVARRAGHHRLMA